MSRIVEQSGIRYRLPDGADPRDADSYERLPHVPDWPLPGPAPQYLSDDPNCMIASGDIVLTVWPGDWVKLKHVTEHMAEYMTKYDKTLSFFLPSYDDIPNGWKAFLVQRKDPEADA